MIPDEPPPLRTFLERTPARLAVEAVLGGAAGVALAAVLPAGAGRELVFAAAGAVSATLALMLTPISGSVPRRAARYGAALAVVLTLGISFAGGADAVSIEALLTFGLLFFGIGTLGHGVVAATLDRIALPSDEP